MFGRMASESVDLSPPPETVNWCRRAIARVASEPANVMLSRWLFLRGLGIVYFVAFCSYWSQVDGLIGSQGILPIAPFLDAVRQNYGAERYWLLPTLAWLNASDASLHVLCAGGALLSLLLIAGVAQRVVLALLWIDYLSLAVAGQTFLNFQWDALLLEAGLVAILFAPRWQFLPRPSREQPPSLVSVWLVRWLAFRIMFLSGLVKLTFDDPTWWKWQALDFHYFTQPIPTWTSWWMHAMPHWWGVASMTFMWWAELVAPFGIFMPWRRARRIAFWSIVGLQILIMATGNYGFFNLLTIVLCIPIVNDGFWPRWLRKRFTFADATRSRSWRRHCRAALVAPLATVIVLVTTMELVESFNHAIAWPTPLSWLRERVAPFRSINGYGLFRVMTTTRREIVIEGSDDGSTWKAYEFKYKPGDPNSRPTFCAPHMPRLDWQMWFAALGDYRENPWFMNFMARLMENSKPVTALLKTNPFPDRPPRYVRALFYDYRFTTPNDRRETGAWWKRELLGLYCPILQRRESQADREFRL